MSEVLFHPLQVGELLLPSTVGGEVRTYDAHGSVRIARDDLRAYGEIALGATYALMDQSREGRELWRYMQMSSHDLLCSLFEHDKVRMHFARVAGENSSSMARKMSDSVMSPTSRSPFTTGSAPIL